MIELTVHSHGNVHFVSKGYDKYFLYFSNADAINSIIYFSIVMFNKFEIGLPCDKNFWKEWIKFYEETYGIKKTIEFTGAYVPIHTQKANGKKLFYSRGKDSHFASLIESVDKIQLLYPMIPQRVETGIETIITNVEDVLWHGNSHQQTVSNLEVLLPILNPYSGTLLGIEKEIWNNSYANLSFNIKRYQKLFEKFGLVYDSPIKHYDSIEILKNLHQRKAKFNKCQSVDTESDFCLKCFKCFTYYIMGANKEQCGFNRKAYEQKHNFDEASILSKMEEFLNYAYSGEEKQVLKEYYTKLIVEYKHRRIHDLY